MPHENATINDRIVIAMTLLAAFALIGAATGDLGAAFFDVIKDIIGILERDFVPRRKFTGPIFLSGYGLWVDYRENYALNRAIEQVMLSLEGDESILEIARKTNVTYDDIYDFVQKVIDLDLAESIGRGADHVRD